MKAAKTPYLPKHTRMEHNDGTVARLNERADIIADYFEKIQWGQTKPQGAGDGGWPQQKIVETMLLIRVDDFDEGELDIVLKKFNNNKSPGEDGLPMEFFKWLNKDARREVLRAIHKIRKQLTSQRHWSLQRW